MKVAILGAGLLGLSCAHELKRIGIQRYCILLVAVCLQNKSPKLFPLIIMGEAFFIYAN